MVLRAVEGGRSREVCRDGRRAGGRTPARISRIPRTGQKTRGRMEAGGANGVPCYRSKTEGRGQKTSTLPAKVPRSVDRKTSVHRPAASLTQSVRLSSAAPGKETHSIFSKPIE